MTPYHRAVLKYLRDTWGIRAPIQYGGRHPFIELDCAGVKRRVILSKTPSDYHAIANTKHDIRRMLDPLSQPLVELPVEPVQEDFIDKSKWTGLDSLTVPDEVQDKPRDITGRGWVACYEANKVIMFVFQSDVKDCMSLDGRYSVVQHGDHPSAGWEIRPGGRSGVQRARARITPFGKQWKMCFGAGKIPAFKRCKADYTVVDGHMLVSIVAGETIVMVKQPSVPVQPTTVRVKPRPQPASEPYSQPIIIPPPSAAAIPLASGTFLPEAPHHAQLRSILKAIDNAELHGWELVHTDAGWRWRIEVGVDE